jgi:hypothetical protein
MIDDSVLRGITSSLEQALALLRQLEKDEDVIASILAGDALNLDQAADVWQCSDEKVRRECERRATWNEPLGVKLGCWIVGKRRLLDLIERHDGKHARLVAEDRAKQYVSLTPPSQVRATTPWNVPRGEPPRSGPRIR